VPAGADDVVGGVVNPVGFYVRTALRVARGGSVVGRLNTAAEDAAARAAGYHQERQQMGRASVVYWYDAAGNRIGFDSDIRRYMTANPPRPVEAGTGASGVPPPFMWPPTYQPALPPPPPRHWAQPPPPLRTVPQPPRTPHSPPPGGYRNIPPTSPDAYGIPGGKVGKFLARPWAQIAIWAAMVLGPRIWDTARKYSPYKFIWETTAADKKRRKKGKKTAGKKSEQLVWNPTGYVPKRRLKVPTNAQVWGSGARTVTGRPGAGGVTRASPGGQSELLVMNPVGRIPARLPVPTYTAPAPPKPLWKQALPYAVPLLVPLLSGKPKRTTNFRFSDPLTQPQTPGLPSSSTSSSSYYAFGGGGTSGGTSDCTCPGGKKRGKKKRRTVCYAGTYTERASGLSKLKKRKVPCK